MVFVSYIFTVYCTIVSTHSVFSMGKSITISKKFSILNSIIRKME